MTILIKQNEMKKKQFQEMLSFDLIGFFDGACEPHNGHYNPGGGMGMGVLFKTTPDLVSNILTTEMGFDNLIYKAFKAVAGDPPGCPKHEMKNSNNVAEYRAFIHALYVLEQLQGEDLDYKKVLICGDSQLLIRQMANFIPANRTNQGQKYRIKNGIYVPLAHKASKMVQQFENLHLWWVAREDNQEADALSIQALAEIGIQPKDQKKHSFTS